MKKVLTKICHKQLSMGLHAWFEYVHESRIEDSIHDASVLGESFTASMQHQQREWACKQISRVMKRVLHAELSAGFGKWVESVALVLQRLDGARNCQGGDE